MALLGCIQILQGVDGNCKRVVGEFSGRMKVYACLRVSLGIGGCIMALILCKSPACLLFGDCLIQSSSKSVRRLFIFVRHLFPRPVEEHRLSNDGLAIVYAWIDTRL